MRWFSTLLAGAVSFVILASVGLGQSGGKLKSPLPEGVRHIPADALAYVQVRVGDLLKTAHGKVLLQEVMGNADTKQGLKQVEQMAGVGLADVESITLVLLAAPPGSQPQRWNSAPSRRFDGPVPAQKMSPPAFDRPKVEKSGRVTELESVYTPVVWQDHAFAPSDPGFTPANYGPPIPQEPLYIVTLTRPVEQQKFLRKIFKPGLDLRGRDASGDGMRLPAILFLSERALLLGPSIAMETYLEAMTRKSALRQTSLLQTAAALSAGQPIVMAGGQMPAALRQNWRAGMSDQQMRTLMPVLPLVQTDAALTLDLGQKAELMLQFRAPNEASSDLTLQAVKSLRVLALLGMEMLRESGEPGGWKLKLEQTVNQALADAVIEGKGTTVQARLKLVLDPLVVSRFMKELTVSLRLQGGRTRSTNNLKQIGLALHSYHDANRGLPPAGISNVNDPTGKPLLSWRVAILPFIEQQALYQQFDLTLPWDHPTNKKLIAQMPPVYVVPGMEDKEKGWTHYRVLVGPGTMFEERRGPGGRQIGRTLVEITDGTSNTIMAVEATDPTLWTRPEDLPYDPKGPLPKFGVSKAGFNALFGDATVRFIRANTPEATIRALISCNGGEVVNLPD